jgi:hypothetical protein
MGWVRLHRAQSWRCRSRAQALASVLQHLSYLGPTAAIVAALACLLVPRSTAIFANGVPQMGGGHRSKAGLLR